MHSIAGGLLLKKSFMRRRWKGVPSCEAETLLSNTMERSNGEFISSLRLTRSFFLEIFGDILGIIYLSLYGVYTFLIYIPFSWLIPHKKKSLKDEVIVAVGANSSGVSKAVVKCLAKEKPKALILIDTCEADEHLMKSLEESGTQAVYFRIGNYTRFSLDATIDKIKSELGGSAVTSIFILTETLTVGPLLSTSTGEMFKIFESNLLSAFHVVQRFFPDLLENNRGHIVSVSYPAFTSWGKKNMVPYISSKCGMEGFMYSLEDEVRHHLNQADIKFTDVFVKLHLAQCAMDFGSSLRHPTLFPILSDETIAKCTVDGYQRNKRYVYVPWTLGVSLWLESFVPSHFIKKARSLLYPCSSQPSF